ncbi:MAG TPA: hypothetical protein VEV38_05520 [Candidatus Eremiobacteraceae bacterium]|nr:hypothetical protein [Candidatus Eremiobacteraceae bacterium]
MDPTQVLLLQQFGGFAVTGALVLIAVVALGFIPNGAMRWIVIVLVLIVVALSLWNFNLMRLDIEACAQIALHITPADPAHDSDVHVCLSAQHLHSMLQVAIAAVIGAAVCGGLLSRPTKASI